MNEEDGYKNLTDHMDKRLKMRLYLYVIISLVLLGIVIYHVFRDFQNNGSIVFPIVAIIVGIFIGFFVTRMYKISWDHGAQKVISQVDGMGVVIIVLYVAFDIFREKLVGYFIHGPLVASTSFALLTGVMIGRVLGIRGKVRRELEENL